MSGQPKTVTEHRFPDKKPSISGYNSGCRCPECRRLKTEWQSRYLKKRYLARGPITVDATPVRLHLRWLKDNGVGPKRVAEMTGMSTSSMQIYRISSGKTKRVRRDTAETILRIDRSVIADTALIDSSLTWRRIHGLMASGWTQKFLAEQLGFNPNRHTLPIARTRTTAANARAVVELVREYGHQPGPCHVVAAYARRKGWLRNGEWDDDLDELTDFVSLTCIYCDASFSSNKPGRRPNYCSKKCADASRKRRQRQREANVA